MKQYSSLQVGPKDRHYEIKVNADKTSTGGKKEKWEGLNPMPPGKRAHTHKKTNECDY